MDGSRTLQDARDFVRTRKSEGVECPCCERYTKTYRRKLNAGMCSALIDIYKLTKTHRPKGSWWHCQELDKAGISTSREYSKLRFWDLVEPHPRKRGYWRITRQGVAFVKSNVKMQSIAIIEDNECLGADGEHISIREALGDKFDLEELLS